MDDDTFNDEKYILYKEERNKLLNEEELQKLADVLSKIQSRNGNISQLSYLDFAGMKDLLGSKYRNYFTPDIYLKWSSCLVYATMPIDEFLRIVYEKNASLLEGMGLFYFIENHNGYLSKNGLYNWFSTIIHESPHVAQMGAVSRRFYSELIVDKILFYLDKHGRKEIKLTDLLTSHFMKHVRCLQSEFSEDANPLNLQSVAHIYGEFNLLDINSTERITKSELAQYNDGDLTSEFIEQLFQNLEKPNDGMDIFSFQRVFLSLTDSHSPSSIRFLFNILDRDKKGYLDEEDLKYHIKAVNEKVFEKVPVDVVYCELVDMVRPKYDNRITLSCLMQCGFGHKCLLSLISYMGFMALEDMDESSDADRYELYRVDRS